MPKEEMDENWDYGYRMMYGYKTIKTDGLMISAGVGEYTDNSRYSLVLIFI